MQLIILLTCSFSCGFPLNMTYLHRSYKILARVALEIHHGLRSSYDFDYEELIGWFKPEIILQDSEAMRLGHIGIIPVWIFCSC